MPARSRFNAPIAALVLALCLALSACAGRAHAPLTLTIAHVNDTHSALEAPDEALVLAGQNVRAPLGGAARLKTALDELRAGQANVLALHAGDAVQGTLYFTLFGGAVEFESLNALGLDAMALGNHEFDRGPAHLARLLDLARFPVLSANLDASAEPALAGRVQACVVREFPTPTGTERVALLGAITPATPLMTKDVGRARFLDPAPVLTALTRDLAAQGVNKIILLSHNGYEADLGLARTVPGLDVIVGGHSHTLLGDAAALGTLGLTPAGPYPTEARGPDGRRVLVVQAWKWGEMLGALTVRFDAAGEVADYTAAPVLLAGAAFRKSGADVDPASPEQAGLVAALTASGAARVMAEDPETLRRLAPYARQVAALQNAPLGARARVDLVRGTATDPGPLVADAYLAAVPGAQIALVGAGGLRRDLPQGELTVGQIRGLLPFGNTLVALRLTGAELKSALEEAVDFRLTQRPVPGGDLRKIPVIHTGGLSYVIRPHLPRGRRIHALRLLLPGGGQADLDPDGTYRVATNSFLAGGGDGLATLKGISRDRLDTGLLEHEALMDLLRARGEAEAPARPRVVIETPAPLPGQRSELTPGTGDGWWRPEAMIFRRA